MPLSGTCQTLYDQSKRTCLRAISMMQTAQSKMDKMTEKLNVYSTGYDLGQLVSQYQIPEVHVWTPYEILDLITNCPIMSCVLTGAESLISLVNYYISQHGPIDPYSPPSELFLPAQAYADTLNAQARTAQGEAAINVQKEMAKSPLGKIGRSKQMLNDYTTKAGLQSLINEVSQTISCMESHYAEAQNDPDFIAFKELKQNFTFMIDGNLKVMNTQQEAAMSQYTQKKNALAALYGTNL